MTDGEVPQRSPGGEESTLEMAWFPSVTTCLLEVGNATQICSMPLVTGQAVRLGSGTRVDIMVNDPAVSAVHAVVEATGRGVRVRDLGSKNGLYVGSGRVREALLTDSGGTFVIGRTTVCVRPEQPEDDAAVHAPLPGLVGNSAAMRRLAREVRRVAGLSRPVLLQGESGTGKDLVARAIHALGRSDGPFVALNVSAIAESLADAELFGHQRGAFTGAVEARPGAFEEADRGTLFLDEIGDLAPSIQPKLLRVIEDGRVRPVGGAGCTRVNARIVCATWAALDERVLDGTFREDLFHRIATFVIKLPPLRERKADIPALCASLLGAMASDIGPRELSSAALACLASHSWPGNVRELSSVLCRAAVASCGETITAADVRVETPRRSGRRTALTTAQARDLLEEHDGNASAAARAAGVARSTFRAWLDGRSRVGKRR